MKDLKEAIIYTVKKSRAVTITELFTEIFLLFYAKAFSDGQRYITDRSEE